LKAENKKNVFENWGHEKVKKKKLLMFESEKGKTEKIISGFKIFRKSSRKKTK